MQKKISVYTVVGLTLAILSFFGVQVILSIIFMAIPAIVLCAIGLKRGNKANRVMAISGIVISIIFINMMLFTPSFISQVNKSRGETAIEYAEVGDYDKAYEYINRITNDEKREYYKTLIEEKRDNK